MDLMQLQSILIGLSMTLSAMQAAQVKNAPVPIIEAKTAIVATSTVYAKTDFSVLFSKIETKPREIDEYTACKAQAKTSFLSMNGTDRLYYQNKAIMECWKIYLTIVK